ncbi:peptide deformylase [PVC group bacterium]|nr:peptide deformylase [PVC group bacterium]
MTYEIIKFGNIALRKKSVRIERVDAEIQQLAKDMLSAMHAKNGIGLAAEQIGRDEAICVIDVPVEETCGIKMPLVMINPQITESDGEQQSQEGCLSFPGLYVKVKRASQITAEFIDLDGRKQVVSPDGLLSRAIQHELDHLNGKLLVDHMSAVQKVANAGKLKRLKKEAMQNERNPSSFTHT